MTNAFTESVEINGLVCTSFLVFQIWFQISAGLFSIEWGQKVLVPDISENDCLAQLKSESFEMKLVYQFS